jgi:cell division septation protein DedD
MFARALIVLLVILNLGVAAWWLLRTDPRAPASTPHPRGVPRLQLVSETHAVRRAQVAVPQADEPLTAPSPAAPAPDAPAPAIDETGAPPASAVLCFSFGPFPDAASASAAQARLPAGTRSARLRSETPRRGGAWTVLMPPQADRAAAQALARRIDAAGFKDYYVMGEGASINGIALGRFSAEEPARRHQAALQAAGFQAQLQEPASAGAATWLDVETSPSFDVDAARAAIGATRAQARACTTATGA